MAFAARCSAVMGSLATAAVLSASAICTPALAQDDTGPLRMGFVTFLSGGAAGPFGIPARNAAEMMIEAINAGEVPAPYNTPGIAGRQIEPVIIDEAGGATKQVAEFRNLVQRQNVDLVVGYISSGDCLAVPPVAEELQVLTVLFDCGTPRVFEEASYKYVFRTGAHAAMDNIAAARYLLDHMPDVKTVAGINQNYAWGQDSWADFTSVMKVLHPETEITTEQFPKIFAGQYGAEISALLVSGSDAVHSSLWGSDLEAFVLQGVARGLFDESQVVLTAGEPALPRLGRQIPDGVIVGARGPHGDLAPPSELNDWFRERFIAKYGDIPVYATYKAAQALLGVKAAYEKAAEAAGGFPTTDQVIAAFEHLEFVGPSGPVTMAIGNGHQAVQENAIGMTKYDEDLGRVTLTNITRYDQWCVNPPDGVSSVEWIKSGMPGAKCE
ncbi:MAG: ABC transporter substrate-binding protein [Rhodospirillaceae bacterium]|nr:ABC transporter substrate-binding protein [Rhodospirillaceae bacterium]